MDARECLGFEKFALPPLLAEERGDGGPCGPAADDDDVWGDHAEVGGWRMEVGIANGFRRSATSAGLSAAFIVPSTSFVTQAILQVPVAMRSPSRVMVPAYVMARLLISLMRTVT